MPDGPTVDRRGFFEAVAATAIGGFTMAAAGNAAEIGPAGTVAASGDPCGRT